MQEKLDSKIALSFHGGVGSVTGANFLLETPKVKILIDCGLIQGPSHERDKNYEPFKYNPEEIDYLFITHAHIDHIGRIGKLIKDGFKGEIYSTPTTYDLAIHMLDDAVTVLGYDAEKMKRKPLYGKNETDKALSLWKTVKYHDTISIKDEFDVTPKDAGHILGSAMFEFVHRETKKKIVFTGDLGNTPTPLLKPTEKIVDADYLIMESVYGDRIHEGKVERKDKLRDVLKRVIERNGTVIMPVFSLEKTQVLLHELNDFIENGDIPSVPVFLDSPLAIKLTEVYRDQFDNFNKEVQDQIKSGDDIFTFPKLKVTMHRRESEEIHKVDGSKIIVASSGMSEGGRVTSHEKVYLPDPNNALILIGFQIAGSLGRRIQEGMKKIIIDKKTIPVKAEIVSISGYSSHKDMNGLLDFVEPTAEKLKKVFTVMGEPRSAQFLAQRIKDYLGVEAIHPKEGDRFEL